MHWSTQCKIANTTSRGKVMKKACIKTTHPLFKDNRQEKMKIPTVPADPLTSSRDGHGPSTRARAARTEVIYLQVTDPGLLVHCWVAALPAPAKKKSKTRDCNLKRPNHSESRDLNPSQQEKTSFSIIPYFSFFSMWEVVGLFFQLISHWTWAKYVSLWQRRCKWHWRRLWASAPWYQKVPHTFLM